jgi:hypothetical protein
MFGGAFSTDDLKVIKDLLAVVAGSLKELAAKPHPVIAGNNSFEGRKKNRRVEIKIEMRQYDQRFFASHSVFLPKFIP